MLGLAALAAMLAVCGPPPAVDPAAFTRSALEPARDRWQGLASLTAFGDLDLQLEGKRFSGRVRAIHVGPGRLRLDAELPGVFGLMGGAGTLWAEEGGLWWTSGGEPGLQTGLDDPIFSPLLGRQPELRDLEVLLFGLPAWWPVDDAVRASSGLLGEPRKSMQLKGQPPSGELVLEWPGGIEERGRVAGDPSVLQRLERVDPEGTLLTLELDAYRSVAGLELPGRLRLRSPRTGGQLELRWRRFEPNRTDAGERLQWPL